MHTRGSHASMVRLQMDKRFGADRNELGEQKMGWGDHGLQFAVSNLRSGRASLGSLFLSLVARIQKQNQGRTTFAPSLSITFFRLQKAKPKRSPFLSLFLSFSLSASLSFFSPLRSQTWCKSSLPLTSALPPETVAKLPHLGAPTENTPQLPSLNTVAYHSF